MNCTASPIFVRILTCACLHWCAELVSMPLDVTTCNAQRFSVCINLRCSDSKLPCTHRSLSLTQYAVRSHLQPHLSPSGDRRGYDSPKRSMFLADLHTWYLGGRGPLAGTLSCRWLLADKPCSPMPGPPPYRSGICTRHSVPRPLGNVAWPVPRWSTQLEEWTIKAKASLISFWVFSLEFLSFLFFFLQQMLRWRNDTIAEDFLN